jgi:hypothetical protein
MSSTDTPGQIEVDEALERLRALDPDSAAVVEYWARNAEVVASPPVTLERAVRVHVASR